MGLRYWLNIVEYGVMNNDWNGWRMGRIELHKEGKNDAIYEGFIRLPDKAFMLLRKELDMKKFDKLPYLNFNYNEEEI